MMTFKNLLCAGVALIALALVACETPQSDATSEGNGLREALTFAATFDEGADAAFAAGSPAVYHAPSWGRRTETAPGLLPDSLTRLAPGEGVHGGALEFAKASPAIVLYQAADNVAYEQTDWSGTLSFWLSLDPDEDLEPGYVDPIQISPSGWNDAALFVDFTRDDDPRHFRFAAFADREVWDPEERSWEEVPYEERPMVEVADPLPFSRGEWTHVVMAFENFNTGEANGTVSTYLNGELQGTLDNRTQTFTWNPEESVIALGLDYVGLIDEIALFDRALTDDEVQSLYELDGGVASLVGP